jgi:two-component system chemotaxis response regulator CheB
VLFDSVAATCKRRAVGVLLTGMGADGARGLLAMRRAGATTAAQNEQTSTVFGMPKVAIEMGAADAVLALGEVSRWINQRAITPAPPASNPALRSG